MSQSRNERLIVQCSRVSIRMHQLGSAGALSDYTMSGVKVCEAQCHLEGTEQAWRLTKGQTQLAQVRAASHY